MKQKITESKYFSIIKNICFALLTANAFTKDFLKFPGFYNYLVPVLTVAFFVFYSFIDKKKWKGSKFIIVAACITSFFLLIGNIYYTENSTVLLRGSKDRLFHSLLCLVGFSLFFNKLYVIVNKGFEKLNEKSDSFKWMDKIWGGKLGILKVSGIILLIWLPIVLVCYPGALNGDASYQIWQTVGRYGYDNIHPLLHTLFLGICMKLGKLLGSYNRGLYLNVLFQTVSMILVMSYSIRVLHKRAVNRFYIMLVMLIYIFAPMYSNFATTTIKDTPFATWVLLYVTVLFDFMYGDNLKISVKNVLKVVIAASLVMLFRNNGVIFVVGAAVPLTICFICAKNLKVGEKIAGIAVYVVLPFVLFVSITLALTNYLNATRINGKEALSIPFQQTSRYIRDYHDEVTPEEWEAIGGVLREGDILGILYNPNISDPIKRQYVEDASNQAVIDYLVVWVKMFFKHPGVYFEAFFNHIYGWFDVGAINDLRYRAENELFYPPRWGNNEDRLQDWFNSFFRNPVLGLLDNVGVYVWWMFLLIDYLAKHKKGLKWTALMLPLVISLLVCLASPCFFLHPRYAFPITFTMPFLTGALITMGENKVKKEQDKVK